MDNFNPTKLAEESKTFCVLPWVHQYIGPGGDVTPCCVFNSLGKYKGGADALGSLKQDNLREIWNNDNTKELRLALLNGEEHPGCHFCTSRISIGDAYKNIFNQTFMAMDEVKELIDNTNVDGSVDEHKLLYIDPRWNNLCNFKCRSCSPEYSSSWIEDHKELYYGQGQPYSFTFSGKTPSDLLEQILPHLDTVKMIYFAGGEPMMQKEHYEVLKKLIEIGNTDVQLRYNTNFSQLQLKNYDNVLNYWKHFKNIHLMVSIDGSHRKAEYWRHGTKWDVILNNVKQLKVECPHVDFMLSYTLSWVNAQNFVELHKEWVEMGLLEMEKLTLNPLDFPHYYSLKNIPIWKKKEIERLFLEHIEWAKQFGHYSYFNSRLENAINFMYLEEVSEKEVNSAMREFARITTRLDNIRKENFFDVFDEHQDMKEFFGDS